MKSEKEREKPEEKNHRRDGLPAEGYEGAEQVTFPPDTTSGGGSPRVSLRDVPIEMDCEGICYREEKASG